MERGIPVRSICRAITALQAINRFGSLSLMEIARTIDLPYPTAYRIVQTLVHEGLIETEPMRKRYRATALVHTLSSGFQNLGNLVNQSRTPMVTLTKKIGWSVAISTHVGQWMMVRDSTASLTSLTFNIYYPGYTFPMLECASGHAYLAFASKEERETILKGLEAVDGPSPLLKTITSSKLLERVRANGYATNERNAYTLSPGETSSISAPVFEYGEITGALTLTFFAASITMNEAVKRYAVDLKATAAEISVALSPDQKQST
jgi:IclR family transcriptional regulator, mhp operon transcriptional activator